MKSLIGILGTGLVSAVVAVTAAVSCTFIHDDQVVASVGRRKLYHSDLVKIIPTGLSPTDSAAVADRYIKSWAAGLIVSKMAEKTLSKSEQDFSAEIEDYKNSLLRYRFEQHYIAQHLDTLVTEQMIDSAYRVSGRNYAVDVPVMKMKMVRFPATLPIRDELILMLRDSSAESSVVLDSLSHSVLAAFIDASLEWLDAVAVARECHTDYGSLIAAKNGDVIDFVDDEGMENYIYLLQYVPSGKVPPVEYCSEKIKDAIMNRRRYELFSGMEKELLEAARQKGEFVIYEDRK